MPRKGSSIRIVEAGEGDAEAFITLVRELAAYEKLSPPAPDAVRRLKRDAFGSSRKFELLMAFSGGEAVAYAVYFMTYSTFLARPTLYLEDIFVKPSHRRKGIGRSMFSRLASRARRRGCGRMEWSVLKWNELARDFYRKLGAGELEDWTMCRLDRSGIDLVAGRT